MYWLFKSLQSDEDLYSSFSSPASQSSKGFIGVRNDLAEIGGHLKSGLSFIFINKAVRHITKLTGRVLQCQNNYDDDDDDDNDYVAGITVEVVGFVMEISELPNRWTELASSVDNQDFRMTSAQRKHVSTVERIIPTLPAFRASLQSYMGNEQFWMLYFILLLPKLNEHDYEILSSPQIIKIRDAFLQKLEKKSNDKLESLESSDTEKASFKETGPVEAAKVIAFEEEANYEWFEDTDINTNISGNKQKMLQHKEVIIFSDLEDDSSVFSTRLSNSQPAAPRIRDPSPSGSGDWVKLNMASEAQSDPLQAPWSVTSDEDFSDPESYEFISIDDSD